MERWSDRRHIITSRGGASPVTTWGLVLILNGFTCNMTGSCAMLCAGSSLVGECVLREGVNERGRERERRPKSCMYIPCTVLTQETWRWGVVDSDELSLSLSL